MNGKKSRADQVARSVVEPGEPALAKLVKQMDDFRRSYADPVYRMTMTFTEIAPVGLLVSLVSAALLRNSRFLPTNIQR